MFLLIAIATPIDFSLVRHATLFPTQFIGKEIPCSKRNQFQLELIPKLGINSKIENRFKILPQV